MNFDQVITWKVKNVIAQLWERLQLLTLHKKLSFPLRISSVNVTKSAGTVDLVTLSEEILNRKLHFLCSVNVVGIYISEWNTTISTFHVKSSRDHLKFKKFVAQLSTRPSSPDLVGTNTRMRRYHLFISVDYIIGKRKFKII